MKLHLLGRLLWDVQNKRSLDGVYFKLKEVAHPPPFSLFQTWPTVKKEEEVEVEAVRLDKGCFKVVLQQKYCSPYHDVL